MFLACISCQARGTDLEIELLQSELANPCAFKESWIQAASAAEGSATSTTAQLLNMQVFAISACSGLTREGGDPLLLFMFDYSYC